MHVAPNSHSMQATNAWVPMTGLWLEITWAHGPEPTCCCSHLSTGGPQWEVWTGAWSCRVRCAPSAQAADPCPCHPLLQPLPRLLLLPSLPWDYSWACSTPPSASQRPVKVQVSPATHQQDMVYVLDNTNCGAGNRLVPDGLLLLTGWCP
jgi:hypothetical protein